MTTPLTDCAETLDFASLEWRDLTTLALNQKAIEVLISLPWCILSIVCFVRRM